MVLNSGDIAVALVVLFASMIAFLVVFFAIHLLCVYCCWVAKTPFNRKASSRTSNSTVSGSSRRWSKCPPPVTIIVDETKKDNLKLQQSNIQKTEKQQGVVDKSVLEKLNPVEGDSNDGEEISNIVAPHQGGGEDGNDEDAHEETCLKCISCRS